MPVYGPAGPTDTEAPPPTAPDDGYPGEPGKEIVRPIEDFFRAQGTYCVQGEAGGCQLYSAPTSNYLAWFTRELGPQGTAVAIDYAGIASNWMQQQMGRSLDTRLTGRVTERPMGDGQSHVTVEIDGSNVMAYAVDHANLRGPLFWGQRVFDIAAGRTPGLGQMKMVIRFINNVPGGPLPDLVQMIRQPQPGQHLESVMLSYFGKGEFGDAYGKGQASGTLSLTYDGSRGPIMPFHPEEVNTPPMGEASIALEAF
jgi:hypothetical protein